MHPKLTETLSKYSTIILVGGGTGGHVQPIVNLLEKGCGIRETNDGGLVRRFLWIGGAHSQEEQAARDNNVDFATIPTFKLTTTRSPKIFLYPFVLMRGILEARKILRSVIARHEAIQESGSPHSAIAPFAMTKPVAVFSKGGPGSVAVGIAAWTLGIPLYIHESDTIPGRSNRLLGKFTTRIFLGFESAKKYFNPEKCETIGQILSGVFEGKVKSEKGKIDWNTNKKHILVICGSQGSRAIFEEILKNLETLSEENEWIIVLGKLNADMRKNFEERIKVSNLESGIWNLVDWLSQSDLAYLLTDTDIAITRGSATTLAEIDTFGVKKIIIPLPYAADNHQYWNARESEKQGDILLEQKDLHQLKSIIKKLGQNLAHSDT